jgi:hypothetical protein
MKNKKFLHTQKMCVEKKILKKEKIKVLQFDIYFYVITQ